MATPTVESSSAATQAKSGSVRNVWRGLFAVQGLVAAFLVDLRLRALFEGMSPDDRYQGVFYHLLAMIDWLGAVMAAAVLVAAYFLPSQAWIDRLVEGLGRRRVAVASGVMLLLAVFAITVHQAYPFTMDEYAPAFQAQIFASGHLVASWPPALTPVLVSPNFRSEGGFLAVSDITGQACSDYAPGHALLLTPFTWLGIPWGCNPVLGGCALLLMAAIAEKLFGHKAAGWSMLLAIASPVFAAYGISFYAMISHCTLNLLYAWLLLSPTLPRVAGAGLIGGFALTLHQPFPHTVFALPWILWLAMSPGRLWRLALIGCCYAAVFIPLELGWRTVEARIRSNTPVTLFANQPTASGSSAAENPQAAVVAMPAAKAKPAQGQPSPTSDGPNQSLLAGLWEYVSVLKPLPLPDLLWLRFASFLRLVAWDAPGLLVVFAVAAWRHRREPRVVVLAMSALTTFFGYSLIAMSGGHGWGYRYFFSAWGCLPILAAGFPTRPDISQTQAVETANDDLMRRIGVAALLSLVLIFPVRCWQIYDFISDHRRQLPPLVTVPDIPTGSWFAVAFIDPSRGYFRDDLVRNDPYMRSGPFVFASHGNDRDERLVNGLARQFGWAAIRTHAGRAGTAWLVLPPEAAARIAASKQPKSKSDSPVLPRQR